MLDIPACDNVSEGKLVATAAPLDRPTTREPQNQGTTTLVYPRRGRAGGAERRQHLSLRSMEKRVWPKEAPPHGVRSTY